MCRRRLCSSVCLNTVCEHYFFFSSRRRHTRFDCDWSSDVCSSDLAPARWPATRGRPRRRAQRPLPSITIATWREELCGIKSVLKKNASPLTGGVNQRFHVIQVALQRAPPGGGEIGRASCRERV